MLKLSRRKLRNGEMKLDINPLVVLVLSFWYLSTICCALRSGFITSSLSTRGPPEILGSSFRLASQLAVAPQQLGTFEILNISDPSSVRQVAVRDYSSLRPPIPFTTAWDWQKCVLNDHLERLSREGPPNQFLGSEGDECGVDTIILLQHAPVYTLGTGSDEKFVTSGDNAVPVIRMDRGGEVTFHGPGQLTVYPVLDLRGYRQDIHWYIRSLEEAIIIALSKCGLDRAERQKDITGVWIDNFKVAAVGIKCRKWITMHGLAVNVEESSLEYFDGIVPCGLEGREVGCINQFLEKPLTVGDFAVLMKESLEEVFRIELVASELEQHQIN
jgi:lipoyl(octanoyl) transferase